MDVTSQPRLAAALQIREPGVGGSESVGDLRIGGFCTTRGGKGRGREGLPRKPLPPHTTMRFLAMGLMFPAWIFSGFESSCVDGRILPIYCLLTSLL